MDQLGDLDARDRPPSRGPLFYVGAAGLLTMMVVETLSVLGRHLGWPLLGALEIIQTAILLAACAAMVTATLTDAHATVHLVVDRLPPRLRRGLARLGALLSALFFAGLLAGSLWLASDFWNAHEESEVLGIPFRPLRLVVCLAAGAIAVVFTRRAIASRSERP
jgi:TRAP-type C4-dicarboxylate transport system permease small subunit